MTDADKMNPQNVGSDLAEIYRYGLIWNSGFESRLTFGRR